MMIDYVIAEQVQASKDKRRAGHDFKGFLPSLQPLHVLNPTDTPGAEQNRNTSPESKGEQQDHSKWHREIPRKLS